MKNSKIIVLPIIALALVCTAFVPVSENFDAFKVSEKVELNRKVFAQKTVRISGVEIVQTVKMNGEILIVEGTDNKITVKGFASVISVQGTDNTVTVDVVNKIKIQGVDNQVRYRSSNNKNNRPSISVQGVDSRAVKIK